MASLLTFFENPFFLASLLALICFALRAIIVAKNPHVLSDGISHLVNYRAICDSKGKIPARMPYTTMKGEFVYPPVLSYILRLLPARNIYSTSRFFSPIIDSISTALIFGMTYYLTSHMLLAFLAGLLFCMIPESIMQSTYLSPRPLGILFSIGTFFSILLYIQGANILFVITAVILVALMCLTHKMALQASFFIFLFLSVIFYSYAVIIGGVLCAGVLLAIIISRGYYLKIFREHIFFLNLWRTKLIRHYSRVHKDHKYVPRTVFLLSKAVYLPTLFFILIAIIFDISLLVGQPFPFSWVIAGTVMFVVTSFKPLLFLGENHRYLAYVNAPVAILSAALLVRANNWWLWLTLALVLLFCLYSLKKIREMINKQKISEEMFKALAFLKKLKKDNVICLPNDYGNAVMYFCKKNVLAPGDSYQFEKFMDIWPVLRKPLKSIIKEHNIDYILIRTDLISKYDLKFAKNIFANSEISIYEAK